MMEIEADDLLKEINTELQEVAQAMMAGAPTWEAYIALVARAKALIQFDENIRTTVQNLQSAMQE